MNRDIRAIIEEGGMDITSLETFSAYGTSKILGWTLQAPLM